LSGYSLFVLGSSMHISMHCWMVLPPTLGI